VQSRPLFESLDDCGFQISNKELSHDSNNLISSLSSVKSFFGVDIHDLIRPRDVAILRTGRAHPSVIFRRRDRLRRSVIFASDSLPIGGRRPPLQKTGSFCSGAL
jgi:hypothetical protein